MSQIDKVRIIPRRLISDERGWFLKAITGTEEDIPSHTGEVYLTMGKPGQGKGGHYHPEAVEWFTVIEGLSVNHFSRLLLMVLCMPINIQVFGSLWICLRTI